MSQLWSCVLRGMEASQLPGLCRGDDLSQLWSWVVVSSSVFFFGGTGASQLPGCEGGRGASQLWSCVLRGMEASQLPGL